MGIIELPDGVDAKVGQYDSTLKFEDFNIDDGTKTIYQMLNEIGPNHDLAVSKNLYTMADIDPDLVYCDTDSAYLIIKLPFKKDKDIKRTVEYIRQVSFRLNGAYLKAADLYFGLIGNWHKDFNTMDFKSEVIAYRGFLAGKKFYGLGIIWNEGTFYDKLKTKKIGGQIVKADATPVAKEMLAEVYEILTLRTDMVDLREIYKAIFKKIKSKYTIRLKQAIDKMNYKYFSIPKKWPIEVKKQEGHPTIGARFYNRVFENRFGPGDSVILLQVNYDKSKIKQVFKDTPVVGENMLPNARLSEFNRLAIPPSWRNKDEEDAFIERFRELGLRPNYEEIISFNIKQKLEPFKELFPPEAIKGIETN